MQVFLSFFKSPISNTTPMRSITVKQIHNYIISNYAKEATEVLRGLMDTGVRRAFKARNFDYVTFSGTFTTRRLNGLVEHSGLMCFDIDKIPTEERLQNIKSQLVNDEMLHTVLLFRSPSGNGLKWVVELPDRHWQNTEYRVQSTDNKNIRQIENNHRALYERIRGYLLKQYEIVTDATSDIARPCYLCHDPDAYFDEPTGECNPNHPFLKSTDNHMPVGTLGSSVRKITDGQNNFDLVERLISGLEHKRVDITGDYLDWVRLGFAFSNTFGECGRGFYHRLSQFHPHYNPNETNRQYDNCMKSNRGQVTLGTAIKLMHNA